MMRVGRFLRRDRQALASSISSFGLDFESLGCARLLEPAVLFSFCPQIEASVAS